MRSSYAAGGKPRQGKLCPWFIGMAGSALRSVAADSALHSLQEDTRTTYGRVHSEPCDGRGPEIFQSLLAEHPYGRDTA